MAILRNNCLSLKGSKNIYRNDELSHCSTEISTEACLPAADPLYFGGRRVATAVEP